MTEVQERMIGKTNSKTSRPSCGIDLWNELRPRGVEGEDTGDLDPERYSGAQWRGDLLRCRLSVVDSEASWWWYSARQDNQTSSEFNKHLFRRLKRKSTSQSIFCAGEAFGT
jgi:hypothetical protein